MKQPINTPRLLAEILVAIALAELGVIFILPLVAPGVEGATQVVLNAAMLFVLAWPVTVWRVRAALTSAGRDTKMWETATPRKFIAGVTAVLVMGLVFTASAVLSKTRQIRQAAQARFQNMTEQLVREVQRPAKRCAHGLKSARGLYAASASVQRGEFRNFFAKRDLATEFPGVQGFGFIQRVMRPDVEMFVAAERKDDAPDFSVTHVIKPIDRAGLSVARAPDLYVIKFIDPLERNRRAWGFDVGSEAVRREAVEQAVRTGEPTLTGRVQIAHDEGKRDGFLFMQAVYKNGTNPVTPQEREAALTGLVYAPIILEDALADVADSSEGGLDFDIFDGEHLSKDTLLYHHNKHLNLTTGVIDEPQFENRMFEAMSLITVGGRNWTIKFSTTPTFEAGIDNSTPLLIAIGGTAMSLLLTGIVWAMGTGRSRAVVLAQGMTVDLAAAKAAAEASLRETAALRGTLETHSIFSVADAKGRIIEINDNFCGISGYSREELLGKDHRILNSGTHSKAFWVEVWRTLAAGKAWRGEVCNKKKDGSLFWVDTIIAPFMGGDGKIEKYVSIRTDITERKQAEVRIAESESLVRTFIEHAPAAVAMFDREMRYISWSRRWRSDYNLADDGSLSGRSHYEVFPEISEEWKSIHQRCLAGGVEKCDRDLFERRNGQRQWLQWEVRPWHAANGAIGGVVMYTRDVTAQVEAELRLAASERRLRTIIETEPECVKVLGPGDEVLEMNQAGLTMLEADSVEQVRSLGLAHFVLPEYHVAFDSLHRRVRLGETGTLVFEAKGLRGTRRWLDTHAAPLRNGAGEVTEVLGMTRDITARRIAEEQLRATNSDLLLAQEAAESASRAKSEFLANMSHEIRTPLTAILGFTELLREDGDLTHAPEQRLQNIDTIRNAGTHLLTIINDILDLSKIEADKMTIERIDTPLAEVLREVESMMRPRAMGKGLALNARLSTVVPDRILSDPTRLRQILMNLVGNAVKFTTTGSVTISAAAEDRKGCSHLVIDVEDTGPGLAKDQAERLFQAFGQGDQTVTRKHGGTGLGLSICRRLALLMGGTVALVRTRQGEGSCFRVELPLEAAPGAKMVGRLEAVESNSSPVEKCEAVKLSGRILLAEDGIDNQRLICFHLRKAGATVEVAGNGQIALEMLDNAAAVKTPFDLLITDMQMPEMDGYTLASTLRQRGSKLPIVALTAHAMAEDRAKCIGAGCDDYASKPINKAALLATCAAWMGKAAEMRAAA